MHLYIIIMFYMSDSIEYLFDIDLKSPASTINEISLSIRIKKPEHPN